MGKMTIEGLKIREYEDLEVLNELLERYEDLDAYEKSVFEAVIEAIGCDIEDAMRHVEGGGVVFYEGQSLEDVAHTLVDNGCFGETPAAISNYIDYAAIARDLKYDSYYETSKGVIYI